MPIKVLLKHCFHYMTVPNYTVWLHCDANWQAGIYFVLYDPKKIIGFMWLTFFKI